MQVQKIGITIHEEGIPDKTVYALIPAVFRKDGKQSIVAVNHSVPFETTTDKNDFAAGFVEALILEMNPRKKGGRNESHPKQ